MLTDIFQRLHHFLRREGVEPSEVKVVAKTPRAAQALQRAMRSNIMALGSGAVIPEMMHHRSGTMTLMGIDIEDESLGLRDRAMWERANSRITAAEYRQQYEQRQGPVHVRFLPSDRLGEHPEGEFERIVEAQIYGWNCRERLTTPPGMPIEAIHEYAAHQVAVRFVQEVERALVQDMRNAEREYRDRLEHERQLRYANNAGIGGRIDHVRDLMAAGLSSKKAKTLPMKTWFKHKNFELNGWTATILETPEQVKDEGATMQHCFAGYHERIAKEKYLAYHITAPENRKLPKSGFTLGFTIQEGTKFKFDQIKGKKNDVHHCQNTELLALIEHIDKAINAHAVPAAPPLETATYQMEQQA